MEGPMDVQTIVQQAIDEFVRRDSARREPAYKTELQEERRRREQLEKRMNELVEENNRSRAMAEEAQRNSTIRAELQKLGVTKVDLAYKAIQDGIVRTEDGRLVARGESGEVPVAEYLSGFVQENPEFLPARIAGGNGAVLRTVYSEVCQRRAPFASRGWYTREADKRTLFHETLLTPLGNTDQAVDHILAFAAYALTEQDDHR